MERSECEKLLDVTLGEAELSSTAKLLAQSCKDLTEVMKEKSEKNREFGEQIKTLDAAIALFSNMIETGQAKRMVKCIIERNYIEKKVRTIRNDTGEIISERSLASDEAQTELPIPTIDNPPMPENY